MKKTFYLLSVLASSIILSSCEESMKHLSDRVFAVASEQYKLMDAQLGPDQYVKTYQEGQLVTTDWSYPVIIDNMMNLDQLTTINR